MDSLSLVPGELLKKLDWKDDNSTLGTAGKVGLNSMDTVLPCFMIKSFKDDGTEDIFNGVNSKASRKICPESIWRIAVRKLDQIDSISTVDELAVPPGNHLEKLTGDREGQYSIRINDQYRICFEWSESNAVQVEIVDYH